MVSWLCTLKLNGSAPNFSWSASAFDVVSVKLPVICGLPSVIAACVVGRRDDLAVEHDRELVLRPCRRDEARGDVGEGLGARVVEDDVDGPLAGA